MVLSRNHFIAQILSISVAFIFSWAELHDSELGGIHSAFSFIFIGRRRRRKPRCGSSSARTLVFGKFISPD